MYRNRDDSMKGSLHRLQFGGANPPSSLPENDISRRVALTGAIDAAADDQPKWIVTDAQYLGVLSERVGDAWAAHNNAHVDIADELVRVAGTAKALAERILRERAS